MRKTKFFLILILCIVMGLSGCAVEFRSDYRISYKTLKAPYDFTVSGRSELYWFGDENTEWYDIELTIDGFKYSRTSEEAYFNLAEGFKTPSDGTYQVKIRGNTSNSGFVASKYATYTHRVGKQNIQTPTLLNNELKKVSWKLVSGVTYYLLTIISDLDTEAKTYQLAPETTSFMLNIHNPNALYYEYSLKAVGDEVFFMSSGETVGAYDAVAQRFTMQTPKNLRVEGTKLVWDAVQDADYYQLVDVLNNVVTCETAEYDITINFIPLKVRAMSRSTNYGVGRYSNEYKYFASGGGTESNPYLIENFTQLRSIDLLETLAVTEKYYYKLTADIEVPNIPANSIREANFYFFNSFGGVFDGNNKKITNIQVEHYVGAWGIFRTIRTNAVVKNLVIDNFFIRVYDSNANATEEYPWGLSASVFAYENFGTIQNCTASNGYLFGDYDVAGIATFNYGKILGCKIKDVEMLCALYEAGGVTLVNFTGAEISDTEIIADVAGIKTVGGIASVNQNGASILNCTYSGTVEAAYEVGGIAGYSEGIISTCTTSGFVKAILSPAGGIVGKMGGGTLISCSSTSIVTPASGNGQLYGEKTGGSVS